MRITPFKVGLIIGFLAAVVQAFFHIFPPPAYGICIACHARDLINWIISHIYPIYGKSKGKLIIPGAKVSYMFPLLTTFGVLIGAYIASKINNEFRWRVMRISWQKPISEFFLGFLVMIFALICGGCPIRITLRSAYLDIIAIVAFVAIAVGVFFGCLFLKKLLYRE